MPTVLIDGVTDVDGGKDGNVHPPIVARADLGSIGELFHPLRGQPGSELLSKNSVAVSQKSNSS